ncbi:hypothetical protein ACFOY2_05590 [Nonomuraea purpurea]|uniref:Uncharacterized protein n=1 Tax=Nonomuraea purpurea TaxID=1849276 RepID=A0ABV8G286_9ACTN
MTSVETELRRIERDALATARARLAAAEDLLDIMNDELAEHLATWDRFCDWVDELTGRPEGEHPMTGPAAVLTRSAAAGPTAHSHRPDNPKGPPTMPFRDADGREWASTAEGRDLEIHVASFNLQKNVARITSDPTVQRDYREACDESELGEDVAKALRIENYGRPLDRR